MRRLSKNAYTEVYWPGCNPSFVTTEDGVVMIDSPQQPIDAVRWREHLMQYGPIRYLVNTEPHGDHIWGNAYFPEVTVVGQRKLAEVFDHYVNRNGGEAGRLERYKTEDPDSVHLMLHPDFPPKPPTLTFDDELVLEVGRHTFRCIHMPGHTAPQTSVHVPQEGVVFTGDNIFCACKTWLQEADPFAWLDALKAIDRLDVEWIVPGHGAPCTKAYLATQAQIIENWLGYIGRLVDQGLTEEEAAGLPLDVRRELDPYPMNQRMFMHEERVHDANIRNLYREIRRRREAGASA